MSWQPSFQVIKGPSGGGGGEEESLQSLSLWETTLTEFEHPSEEGTKVRMQVLPAEDPVSQNFTDDPESNFEPVDPT